MDHELSIGIARKDPSGKAIGASKADKDMVIDCSSDFTRTRWFIKVRITMW